MLIKRIYNEWRLLFWILLAFAAGQLFFMAKGIENIPFFLYHMYSRDQQVRDSIPLLAVRVENGYFDPSKISGREQELLYNSAGYYLNLIHDGDGTATSVHKRFGSNIRFEKYAMQQLVNDSARLERYEDWWRKYFHKVAPGYDRIGLHRIHVYSHAPYRRRETDSLIFTTK